MADKGKPSAKRKPQRARNLKMDAARKALFLEKLAEYGVAEWAAVEASPGATGSCISSFHDERNRDPQFDADWIAAADVGRMRVLGEAYRRATVGEDRLDKDGNVVGKQYSDSLMGLILKSKPFGDRFVDRQHVEHSGKVTTKRDLGIADLSPEKRELLKKLLADEDDGGE